MLQLVGGQKVNFSEVFTCPSAVSEPLPVLNAWEVGIDTMASDHVIVNERLLTSQWESPYNVEISGVGGSVTTHLEGHMKHFGTVNLSLDGAANLLSFARLSDEFEIDWDQSRGVLSVHADQRVFEFRRRGNLYVCDMRYMSRGRSAHKVQPTQGSE